ncbi:DeoR/GlpR family DNA-binding transcription regulator [Microbacterium sp.]|uniref:DeoR/GlpR family DNA-binding transcription regulator n=1 Tax=Microbacterium sp. TaxID=51671 RepID=UPI002631D502|nr:DeoR/GlpR family DNA-binding transcription regulator [Microbacterium sp.]
MTNDKHGTQEGERSALSAIGRHESIAALIESDGRVEVSDLAERLSVSEETIRRDLRVLESDGRLVRAHGGAVRPPVASHAIPTLDATDRPFFERIAAELPAQGTVYLDGDALSTPIVGLLSTDTELTVVTPRLDLAIATSLRAGIEVLSLGGEVSATGAQSGEWARSTLTDLHLDTVVIFADGCTETGALLARPADALLRRTALAGARRTVLAFRLGEPDPRRFTTFATITDFDTVIASSDAETTVLAIRDDAVIVAEPA